GSRCAMRRSRGHCARRGRCIRNAGGHSRAHRAGQSGRRVRAAHRHGRGARLMHAILTVFSKEFRENLRDRRTLFTALIFGPLFAPLLFAAILSLMVQRSDTQKDQPLELAIAHAERAPNLVSQFVAYGVTVVPVAYEDADARAAVRRHEHKLILMVPEDYATRFAAGRPAPLTLYS